jgi:hypothetical protein
MPTTSGPPGWSLEMDGEQFMLTPYLTPIFVARLCQPPHEFLSSGSFETRYWSFRQA